VRRMRIALLLVPLATGLTGCALMPGTANQASIDHSKPSTCVIADLSGSTHSVRSQYVDSFSETAREDGLEGSGNLCMIVAAGDPTQRRVATASVGPIHRGNSTYAPPEVKERVDLVTGQFRQVLINPGRLSGGSALMESASVASNYLKSGDVLVFYSDAFQNSPLINVYKMEYSDADIEAALDTLQARRLLPDLHGVSVRFPFPLVRPEGSGLSATELAGVHAMWERWAVRTGAKLRWGA
jgi:hypothetical protein